jgi:hypothetical protein
MKVIHFNQPLYTDMFYHNFKGVIIDMSRDICFFKNGRLHNENGPSVIYYKITSYDWFFKGNFYGADDNFTNKSWKRKIKELKRQERLTIFK